jgi:hypothetical protein
MRNTLFSWERLFFAKTRGITSATLNVIRSGFRVWSSWTAKRTSTFTTTDYLLWWSWDKVFTILIYLLELVAYSLHSMGFKHMTSLKTLQVVWHKIFYYRSAKTCFSQWIEQRRIFFREWKSVRFYSILQAQFKLWIWTSEISFWPTVLHNWCKLDFFNLSLACKVSFD